MDCAVEIRNLTEYYDNVLVADHIKFEAKKGNSFRFLDPIGAVKTTEIGSKIIFGTIICE